MKTPIDLMEAIREIGGRVLQMETDPADPKYSGGQVILPCDTPGTKLQVIHAADAGWDHVSACVLGRRGGVRVPNYNEMQKIKLLYFKPDEIAVEYHVPTAKHINHNPHVLHLWRPHDVEIPLPPIWMV
jgi:hypothetical protein